MDRMFGGRLKKYIAVVEIRRQMRCFVFILKPITEAGDWNKTCKLL
jgi:hypothetical protein